MDPNRLRVMRLAIGLAQNAPAPYGEKYHPQYRFSPRSGWIGDPCGLVHYNGVSHLFWWGHATSTDLVHWEEKP